ncbi:multidrug DMT transporter permease [Algoriphagus sediminis]|uniref:Multidrug DMT transporter permease n=1 Tax=Algoriphagus sediminis TaxID=3057113 RepID=A0ABT7YET6_9BACT|nr:multidrug DMT transporter permease [Algoriphagus sediminis]MDN3205038.1 multidrug DMT transporter permease [Algoriphagus sediminis]
MFIPESYGLAVVLCVITMICWGSWANTQKLASKSWPFPLFYWDYALGIVILSLIFGLTLGSMGEGGRSFLTDLGQADSESIISALIAGIIFNLANLLIVAAIDIAGMAVAFPVGIGIALVLGVLVNYMAEPIGDPVILFLGVGLVVIAIIIDAVAYGKLSQGKSQTPTKGILLSIAGGVLMGFFYRFVAASISTDFAQPEEGLMTPYSAVFVFSIGIFVSNFLWNTFFMYKPLQGNSTTYSDYFKLGNPKLHLVGILGGIIWCIGMSLSVISGEKAGFAISYGLGQGATMVAAAWGVFVWKEFKDGPKGTNTLVRLMFLFFIAGLALIIISRNA